MSSIGEHDFLSMVQEIVVLCRNTNERKFLVEDRILERKQVVGLDRTVRGNCLIVPMSSIGEHDFISMVREIVVLCRNPNESKFLVEDRILERGQVVGLDFQQTRVKRIVVKTSRNPRQAR